MRFVSYDLLAQEIVEEVPFSAWRFNDQLSPAPGGFACSIQTSDPRVTTDVMAKGRHAIVAMDDDNTLRFGGILWSPKVSQDRQTFTAGGEGLWSYFHGNEDRNRYLRTAYTNTMDQLAHVIFLIAIAQSGAGEDLGLTVRFPAASGITRTLSIKATERKSFAQIIEDMATADDGFEFAVTPQWVNGQIKLFLDLFYPQRGRVLDSVWQLGKHVELAGDWGPDTGANRIDAIGGSSGGVPLIETASNPPVDQLRVDKIISFTDVTDSATLLSLAKGERRRQARPQGGFSVLVTDHNEAGLATFSVGDTVALVGDLGYTKIDALHRITGYEASGGRDAATAVKVDLEPA